MATEALLTTLKALQQESGEETSSLQPKDFSWDQFLKYISSAILALTVLNVSVDFLRGGGVQCFPPPLSGYIATRIRAALAAGTRAVRTCASLVYVISLNVGSSMSTPENYCEEWRSYQGL